VFVLGYSSVFGPPALGGPARAPGHWKLPRPRLHRQRIRQVAPVPLGVRVVDYARRMLGVPYVWGGASPATGFDCSGFVRFVYSHFGVALPHSSYADFDLGRRVARGNLRPGDLVFFDGIGHVGMYVGGGRFIHAPHSGTDVQITSLSDPWYRQSYDGARRLIRNPPRPRTIRNLFGS
jgi:cell wall-associated NlpC family hydrolase